MILEANAPWAKLHYLPSENETFKYSFAITRTAFKKIKLKEVVFMS